MPFSQEKYDALLDAIQSGTTSISYSGKTVAYRSLAEMQQLATWMKRHLDGAKTSKSATLVYRRRSIH